MNKSLYITLERVIIAVMLLGMVGMFQPWQIDLYHYGFVTLLVGTLAFIIISHVPVNSTDD